MGSLQYVLDLILTPGSSMKLVPVINVSILSLLLVVLGLLWNTIDKIHLVVLTFLSLGLLISVNWVAIEYAKIIKSETECSDNQNITRIKDNGTDSSSSSEKKID